MGQLPTNSRTWKIMKPCLGVVLLIGQLMTVANAINKPQFAVHDRSEELTRELSVVDVSDRTSETWAEYELLISMYEKKLPKLKGEIETLKKALEDHKNTAITTKKECEVIMSKNDEEVQLLHAEIKVLKQCCSKTTTTTKTNTTKNNATKNNTTKTKTTKTKTTSKKGRSVCDKKGWIKLGGSCYMIHSKKAMNWFNAKKYCTKKGGYLAEITSHEEWERVRKGVIDIRFKKRQRKSDPWPQEVYWIGLWNGDSKKTYGYTWAHSRTPLKWNQWQPEQPKSWSGMKRGWSKVYLQSCAQIWWMFGRGWGWDSAHCKSKTSYRKKYTEQCIYGNEQCNKHKAPIYALCEAN